MAMVDTSSTAGKSDAEVLRAAGILQRGGVVAFPTETVYGLGASALDAQAVARVFEIKGRPRFDPLIAHVADLEQAESLLADFPPLARELARRFWPGPLTLVLPKAACVPDIVTSGLQNVAIRMPDHPLALSLIRAAGVPLAAPSANPFGHISPTTAAHVREQLGPHVDMVLDGGPCRVGVESTIISLVDGKAVLLRAGGLPVEEVESVVGPVARQLSSETRPVCPGQLTRHYAPRTRLILGGGETIPAGLRVGLLAFTPHADAGAYETVEVLSRQGDLREAAAGLFAAMRRLDARGLDLIVADAVPEHGLGLAIMDRLRRASAAE